MSLSLYGFDRNRLIRPWAMSSPAVSTTLGAWPWEGVGDWGGVSTPPGASATPAVWDPLVLAATALWRFSTSNDERYTDNDTNDNVNTSDTHANDNANADSIYGGARAARRSGASCSHYRAMTKGALEMHSPHVMFVLLQTASAWVNAPYPSKWVRGGKLKQGMDVAMAKARGGHGGPGSPHLL